MTTWKMVEAKGFTPEHELLEAGLRQAFVVHTRGCQPTPIHLIIWDDGYLKEFEAFYTAEAARKIAEHRLETTECERCGNIYFTRERVQHEEGCITPLPQQAWKR